MKKIIVLSIALLVLIGCSSNDDTPTNVNNEETSKEIHAFAIGEKKYELVKINKTWIDAVAFAISRGGYLVEIDNPSEQSNIYSELQNRADITPGLTTSGDGGNAAYVWLGGNDLDKEGEWVWDGNNDKENVQFWEGNQAGVSVNGMFSKWGDEPDNFENQDFLGIALEDWRRGSAGEWNDLKASNLLYFIIEY